MRRVLSELENTGYRKIFVSKFNMSSGFPPHTGNGDEEDDSGRNVSDRNGNTSNGSNANGNNDGPSAGDLIIDGDNDSEDEFEQWNSGSNQDEDDQPNNLGERDGEDDDDDSSEVGPDILNDISETEDEDQGSSSRRRLPKPKRKACQDCRRIKERWYNEVSRLKEEFRIRERELNNEIRKLEEKIEKLEGEGKGIEWKVSLGAYRT